MSYYEPLTRFLEGRGEGEVMLTFRQLEDIIDRRLPPSARRHQAWWANTASHSHADAWLRLDWKTAKVDLASERVVFARAEPHRGSRAIETLDSREPAGTSVVVDLGLFSAAALRLIDDYAREMDGDRVAAVARAVHEAAIARRGRLVREWVATAPRVPPGEPDSAALVREDRDAR